MLGSFRVLRVLMAEYSFWGSAACGEKSARANSAGRTWPHGNLLGGKSATIAFRDTSTAKEIILL